MWQQEFINKIGLHTRTTPLEAAIVVANAAVEVDLGVDELAVLTGDASAQPAALVDVDGGDLGGVVEVGHFEVEIENGKEVGLVW